MATIFLTFSESSVSSDDTGVPAIIRCSPTGETEGVIIRTLPNGIDKKARNYSGQNPAYLDSGAVQFLVENGCKHLVLDLPSVDRESDEGRLLGHKAFWTFPENPRMECTITELAYIPTDVKDGLFLLNLQVAPFENDAAPSRPVLYPLSEE